MKKLLAILLAVVLLASLVACGDKGGALIGGVNENEENDIEATFKNAYGTFTYEYVESDTIRIVDYAGTIELHDVVIEAVVNNLTIVEIADGAFYALSNIKSVTIPDTVTSIGKNAFAGCQELVSVTLPASLTTLGTNAFYQCDKLTTVTFTNTEAAALTAIPASAFKDCVALAQINLPATVKTIGTAAFMNCDALVDFTMPAALDTVGEQAFQNCGALANVTFSDKIAVCGAYAFEGCDSLANVVCPVLNGWKAIVNPGTDDEEMRDITFGSVEEAIDILTQTHFKYTLVRAAD